MSSAYQTCAKAQEVAAPCVQQGSAQDHRLQLDALYRDVTLQGEIAMFAQQFKVAQALLHERLQVLALMQHDGRISDVQVAAEHKLVDGDMQDASAGLCATSQYDRAPEQAALAHGHKWTELARFLNAKFRSLQACSKQATTAPHRAYIAYLSYVALEEAGRAAQAAGNARGGTVAFDSCIDGTGRAALSADSVVQADLRAIKVICQQRAAGTLAFDKPQALDAGADRFLSAGASPAP